ncbi:thioesterase family protein [Paraburkholderia sp.]|uniref:acyl-CoA thioesterase n=1 Tax=Paraburkholderia sp. TaxID=1926495 RepID=UPI00257F0EC0|nr:thioesterase family protein [Paraburkholderia sp.]
MNSPILSTESLVSVDPVTIRRRVKWGECDPAGVVYTVTFSEYVISAAEIFYGVLFDCPPQKAKQREGFGTPTRALSFDFERSLRPDEEFEIVVTVGDVRQRSYVLNMVARTLEKEPVFTAELTPVCVARDERRSIDIPDNFRRALLKYQDH